MKVNLILNIEVCAPMTDFGGTFQFGNFQNRKVVVVMNSDSLLLFHDKIGIGVWDCVAVWSISNSCARLCNSGVFFHEVLQVGWLGVRDDAWTRSSGRWVSVPRKWEKNDSPYLCPLRNCVVGAKN